VHFRRDGRIVETIELTTYDAAVTTDARKLLEDALTLAPNDRAQLAAELLASLDEAEDEVEAAWAAEIQRRATEARENPEDDEDWRVALDEIQREVLSR
jgi:putative addiction module component (TIGR02574 family)